MTLDNKNSKQSHICDKHTPKQLIVECQKCGIGIGQTSNWFYCKDCMSIMFSNESRGINDVLG